MSSPGIPVIKGPVSHGQDLVVAPHDVLTVSKVIYGLVPNSRSPPTVTGPSPPPGGQKALWTGKPSPGTPIEETRSLSLRTSTVERKGLLTTLSRNELQSVASRFYTAKQPLPVSFFLGHLVNTI